MGVKKFVLDVQGNSMNYVTIAEDEDREYLKYPQLFDRWFSVKGAKKYTGEAPVVSFEPLDWTEKRISYKVTIDDLRYPTLNDYAEKLKPAIESVVEDTRVTYDISKTEGDEPMDLIRFNLIGYNMEDFERDFASAIQNISADLVQTYLNGNEETKKALKAQYPDIDEIAARQQQKVTITGDADQNAADLERAAIQGEEKPIQPTPSSVLPASNQAVTTNQPTPPPTTVIVSPSEKATITKEKQSKERSLIESISNSVFDRRIMEYERQATQPTKESNLPKLLQSPANSIPPSIPGKESSESITNQKTSITTGNNVISSALESVLGPNVILVPFQLPAEQPVQPGPQVSSEISASTDRQRLESMSRESSNSEGLVSSITDSIRQAKDSISSFSGLLESRENESTTDRKNVITESLSFLGLTPSTISESIDRLKEVAVTSERATTQNNALQEMTNRVVGTETTVAPKIEINTIVENLGNSITSAITNAMTQNKKSIQERESATPTPAITLSNPAVSNNEENNQANMGGPSIQNFSGGGASPTIVSLSQSTIDSLASAIIKNMSISPFLNRGA